MPNRKKGPWTVVDSCEKYVSYELTVLEDSVVGPDEKPSTFALARIPGGALVLPVDDDGSVYLVCQYRYGSDCETLEAPAGTIDEGETAEDAARRELKEELGITARELADLGELFPVPSLVDMRERLFLARGLEFGCPQRDASEQIEVVRTPFDEAVRMAECGRITTASTCALLLRARPIVAGWVSRASRWR